MKRMLLACYLFGPAVLLLPMLYAQDVARAAHVAPDAVEDLLQRLAAKGEVHLEGKRDFSVALWVDLEAGVWQGISGQAQPVGKAEETSSLARNVLAQMSSLQSTMVRSRIICCCAMPEYSTHSQPHIVILDDTLWPSCDHVVLCRQESQYWAAW